MTNVNTAATNRRVGELITAIRDGHLKPNPTFQRRLVWSATHKAEFVRTVLLGLPFPEVFISQGEVDVETGDSLEWLVDGQQRLTTLASYFSGALDIRFDRLDLPKYTDLDVDEKTRFLQYQVAVRDLGAIALDEVVDVFQRINSTGYSLNAMEVNNARYDGPLKRFAESIPDWDVVIDHKVFTATDAKRMNDVRYCLSLVITLMSDYFNRDSEHEAYLERYNDEFPEQVAIERRLRKAFDALAGEQFDLQGRAWRKGDLFTLITEIDRVLESGGSPDFVALDRFFDELGEVASATRAGEDGAIKAPGIVLQYLDSSIQAVNDRGNRQRRGEILRKVLSSEY